MAPTSVANRVLRGLMRTYVVHCGIREVRRKKPLTNGMINGMLGTPQGTAYRNQTVDWTSYTWISHAAWVSVLAESGERKDEIAKAAASTPFMRGRLTFASLVWRIAAAGGEIAGTPTAAQFAMMDERAGDGVYLKHGRAKNDFFGIFFAPGSRGGKLPGI